MAERPTIWVKTRDILPYRHGVVFETPTGEQHYSEVVHKRWSKPGCIYIGFDNHTGFTEVAGVMTEVIEWEPNPCRSAAFWEQQAEKEAVFQRSEPSDECSGRPEATCQ